MTKPLYLKFAFVVFITLASSFQIYSQNRLQKIDSILNAKYPSNTTRAVFLIAEKGKIKYKKAFGLANLELNVPMNSDNIFEIGSMTKQFTAISILMLEEQGKINLDDDITKFIPDYPTKGHRTTVHSLLTHTSGIKDFTRVKGLNDIASKDLKPIELIDFFKSEPMDFLPGEQFKYNNSGYIILGYIIEKVTGSSYANFVEEQIFKKLKMNSSQYASHSKVIPNRASGYQYKKGYINSRNISFNLPYASGSLMANVNDMYIWQEAIKNNLLINKETTQKAFTNYTLINGKFINYGYGWHIKSKNDLLSVEHGGSIFGFKSMGVYLPDFDVYVIGLTNCDGNSPTAVTREIAEIFAKN